MEPGDSTKKKSMYWTISENARPQDLKKSSFEGLDLSYSAILIDLLIEDINFQLKQRNFLIIFKKRLQFLKFFL